MKWEQSSGFNKVSTILITLGLARHSVNWNCGMCTLKWRLASDWVRLSSHRFTRWKINLIYRQVHIVAYSVVKPILLLRTFRIYDFDYQCNLYLNLTSSVVQLNKLLQYHIVHVQYCLLLFSSIFFRINMSKLKSFRHLTSNLLGLSWVSCSHLSHREEAVVLTMLSMYFVSSCVNILCHVSQLFPFSPSVFIVCACLRSLLCR